VLLGKTRPDEPALLTSSSDGADGQQRACQPPQQPRGDGAALALEIQPDQG
jgi:hypothetical protein